MRALLVIALSFALYPHSSLAAKSASKVELPAAPENVVAGIYNAKANSELVAMWAKGQRKPASAGQFTENDLSPSFKMIRGKFLAAKTADDMDRLLGELEISYDKLSDDSKFFASQMLLMKPMRGIVWRMRPLFENKKNMFDIVSGNVATHAAAVTAVRVVAHASSVYLPTDQSAALFDYLVAPSKDMLLSSQFKTMTDFQVFARNEMYPSLQKAASRVAALPPAAAKAYVWDNQMLYGTAAFQDGVTRYVGIGDAEVLLTAAGLQRSMHDLLVFCAYNQDQLMNVMGDIGKLHGVNGFIGSELGVTSRERSRILNNYRSKQFLTLRTSQAFPTLGKDYMSAAYSHLRTSIQLMSDAQDVLKAQPNSQANLLNPLFFKTDVQPHLDAGIASLQEAANKRTTVRSPITGEAIEVDIPAMYANPPASLLDLLPTAWESTPTHEVTFKNNAGEKITYRNYQEGRPIGWNAQAWSQLFPNMTGKTTVADAFRTLSYSHGPIAILGRMSYFIY